MKHILVLFLAASLLTACGGTEGAVTTDPFMAVEQAERTAEAAQEQADFYGRQLTATAEAPIVQITATALAFAMEQEFARATQQSQMSTETAAMTATAMSWTPTPNATSTQVAMQIAANGTKIANQIEMDNLRVQRERDMNNVKAMLPYVVAVSVLLAFLMLAVGLIRKASVFVLPTDSLGNPQPLFLDGVVIDAVENRDQLLVMQNKRMRLPRNLLEAQTLRALPEPSGMFPLPAWEIIDGWQGDRSLRPYGLTSRGLGYVNIERTPHIAVLGATRTGKSRRFNRPFIACALAAGDRVFILGKATDYQVFDGHPNAYLMKLSQMTEPKHAEPYVRTLKAIVEEMNRREEYLITARQSTWQRAGRATTWVILDEFGNALRQLPNGLARQAENWVECLVAEGAKNGLNIVVANQRATGLAATLSQTGKAIFRVEADEEKSHRSLQNASALDTGYFYARFGDLQLAGAFEPSDEEIRSFLEKRPARALENDWIDGEVFEQGQLSAGPTLPSPRSEIAELAESVRGEWSPTMSKRALGRLLGKEYAGSWAGKIDRIMEYLSATTTENRPEMGLGAA